ncbi:MAG: cytochrome-c peroxidase [Thermaurantimonas sp.]|uniref:cytochrome-c peroxidase n=1 Tax=Thermaurantimonas sp. TaxID=2681568 RepID=UPI00391D1A40
MKRKIQLSFVIASLIIVLYSFTTTTNSWDANVDKPLKEWLDDHFTLLDRQLADLEAGVARMKNNKAIPALIRQFKKSRYTYKKLEVISATVDSYNAKWINGPNLPKVEYEKTMAAVSEPEGFQVIEEELYGDEVLENKDFILKKIQKLRFYLKESHQYIQSQTLYDWLVFHSLRMAAVRLATLGITGFDCPVSLDAIEEARHTLRGIWEVTELFNTLLYDDREGYVMVRNAVNNGDIILNSVKNFDALDRARFIKECTDPIFRGVTWMQESLGTDFPEERIVGLSVVNPFSKGLFYDDFLKVNEFFPQKTNKKPNADLVALGKTLFYDPVLSDDHSRSCASCHQPGKGFTDGLKTPMSLDGKPLKRNTPTLLNVVYQNAFQWDGHLTSLSQQFTEVTLNRHEMNKDALELTRQLNSSEEYRQMFKKALGSEVIDFPMVIAALEAYMMSLKSLNSPFDLYMTDRGQVSADVIQGFNVFMGKAKCATCHFAPVFNGSVPPFFRETEFEVLGVPSEAVWQKATVDPDEGRYTLAHAEPHKFAFKTMTVRNAALTAPYMHNGVYQTLDEVIRFYDLGGGHGIGIQLPNQTLPPDPLKLTEKEKKALVAFMSALTDTTGLTTPPARLPRLSGEYSWLNARRN